MSDGARPARPVEGVISDFGGVLTTPLLRAFGALEARAGIPPDALGRALARTHARDGANPLFELEKGRVREADFLADLTRELAGEVGRDVDLRDFGAAYFAELEPNQPMIDYLRDLRRRGLRLALCTNNVREWEPLWRAMVPVDELFDVVVDSAFVGMRKPEPEIYALTLARLDRPATACVFVDDVEANCDGARRAGMRAVRFESADQAIAEVKAVLGG